MPSETVFSVSRNFCGDCRYYTKIGTNVNEPYRCYVMPPEVIFTDQGEPTYIRGGCPVPKEFPACHMFSIAPEKVN